MSALVTIAPLSLQSLQKRLELTAGFLTGDERFSLRVTAKSDESWWDHKRRSIQLGVEGVEEEQLSEIADLLMEHEISHVLHTSRGINGTTLSFPFSLLNILEDARIEPKRNCNFFPLHSHSYNRHYLSDEDAEKFSNPFNIGILLRWRRSGLETTTARPEKLSETQYAEFCEDWDYFIDRSIEADSTLIVCGYAKDLYDKWRFLFDNYESGGSGLGSIEKSAAAAVGEGEPSAENPYGSGSSSTEITDAEEHFGEAWFSWDLAYIAEQARILRRLLNVKSRTEMEFALSGRRFDPRRIDNPPLAPFRKAVETFSVLKLKRLLLILDGSGSMQGDPFQNGSTIAYILSEVFDVDLLITTTDSRDPIYVPLKDIDILCRFAAWGGGENYLSAGNRPCDYSFTLFLTDAQVAQEDQEYVQQLSKRAKVGAGYVGMQGNSLEDVFERNFYSEQLDQNIGRMVALFLRRFFMRHVVV
ncbi:MAG: hypothetical protein ACHQ0Y_05015 [Thermodesulfovibrionales bacterium]